MICWKTNTIQQSGHTANIYVYHYNFINWNNIANQRTTYNLNCQTSWLLLETLLWLSCTFFCSVCGYKLGYIAALLKCTSEIVDILILCTLFGMLTSMLPTLEKHIKFSFWRTKINADTIMTMPVMIRNHFVIPNIPILVKLLWRSCKKFSGKSTPYEWNSL